ncbi:MAG: DNA/RNA non-specific endonuclease [Pseudomonadota bacterium]
MPDPAGNLYDQMIRQQKADQSTKADALWPNSSFTPSARLEGVRRARPLGSTVTIGGRTYREIDNGSANVLVPLGDAMLTDAELASRRRTIERAQAMTQSPIGTAASGLVGLLGGSQKAQDATFQLGALVDATGGAVRARPQTLRRPSPPPMNAAAAPLRQDTVRVAQSNKRGQASGVSATLQAAALGTGTKPDRRIKPPGWQGNGTIFNEARGHLLGRNLGGSGRDSSNLVTLTQNGANTPKMRDFENGVARQLRAGEIVEYLAKPLYGPNAMAPAAVLLTALGSRSGMSARLVRNAAGAKR